LLGQYDKVRGKRIMALLRLTRQEYAAAGTTDQKQAIDHLEIHSVDGNPDVTLALNRLNHMPGTPPF